MQPSYWDLCKPQTHSVNQNISIGIATKLRAGLPRNLASILGKEKYFVVFSNYLNRVCGPPTLQLNGYSSPFTTVKEAGV
jgi:hypothetical protein